MSALLDLVFPPVCVHCSAPTDHRKHPLCKHCLELIEFIDPNERCPLCFRLLKPNHRCMHAVQRAAVFDYDSPAAALFHIFKKKKGAGLAPALAAFMVLQVVELGWPLPQMVVPVPQPFWRSMGKLYLPHKLLAAAFAQICSAEMSDILKQGADRDFYWKTGKAAVADKNILLIGDGLSDKEVFRAVKRMREGFPKSIRFISFL